MRDRQLFEIIKLSNGMKIYWYPDHEAGRAEMRLYAPVGSAHNCQGVLGGTAHFLEHVLYDRSNMFPDKGSLERFIGLRGGYINARTSAFHTSIEAQVPTTIALEAWKGIVESFFRPLFTQADVDHERGIIINERKRWRWFPGRDEVSKWFEDEVATAEELELFQSLGSDSDLAAMTPENLLAFQKNYFTPNTFAILAGDIDIETVATILDAIPIQAALTLPTQLKQPTWLNREYREKAFRDVGRHTLRLGGFKAQIINQSEYLGLDFLLRYLCNTVHGVLYDWLRKERGWSYEISWRLSGLDVGLYNHWPAWGIVLPLPSRVEVPFVRQQWRQRVEAALSNSEAINIELQRRLGRQVFDFQTLGAIVDGAHNGMLNRGSIISMQDSTQILMRYANPAALLSLYGRFMRPEDTFEVLLMPTD